MQFIAVDHPSLWTQLPLRGKLNYEIELPVGSYLVRSVLTATADSNGVYQKVINPDDYMIHVQVDDQSPASTLKLSTLDPPRFHHTPKGRLLAFDKEDVAEIDAFFERLMDYYEIPGIAIALIKDGEMAYHQTYGVQNLFTNEEVLPHYAV